MKTAIATRPRPSSLSHVGKPRYLFVALLSAILTVFISTAVTSPAIARTGDGSAQTASKPNAGKKAAKKKKAVKKEAAKTKRAAAKKAARNAPAKKAGKPKAGDQKAKKKASGNKANKKAKNRKKPAKKVGKPKPAVKKTVVKKKAVVKKAKPAKTVTVQKKVTRKALTVKNPKKDKKKAVTKKRNKKGRAKAKKAAAHKQAVARKKEIARKKRAARKARAKQIRRKQARRHGPAHAYPEPRGHDALAVIIDGAVRAIERYNGRAVVGHPAPAPRPATRRHVKQLPNGRKRIVVIRPNGVRIVTIRARDGGIVRRTRRTPDGRVTVLIDNRPTYAVPHWRPLPAPLPPVAPYPGRQPALDAGQANAQELERALTAPPSVPVERTYSLEELRQDGDWLDHLNRVDVKSITFTTGSAHIDHYEIPKLAELARAMHRIIADNPDEIFMVSGHTDLVGDELSNLELSNERAEAIADALVRFYAIPARNLVTQGYGERYPVILTPYAERQNRRVSVQRITPLLRSPEPGTSQLPLHLR